MKCNKTEGFDDGPEKGQWISQLFLLLVFQSTLYFSIGISVYAIVTVNYQLGIFLSSSVSLQRFVTKSKRFVQYVQKNFRMTQYFKRFKRIYEEPVTDSNSLFCVHPHSILAYCKTLNI